MAKKGNSSFLADVGQYTRAASIPKQRHIFKTGIIGLDYMLGKYRGIPGGSLVQIIGKFSSGKSTLALKMLAKAQMSGVNEVDINGRAVNSIYVDFERTFDASYAAMLGVDLEKLLIIETMWGEDGFKAAEKFLALGIQVVIVDSVAMFVPQDEEDKEVTESQKMAASASVLTRAVKRAVALVDNANALYIFINQYRKRISSMPGKEVKPAGPEALQQAVCLTLELTRGIKQEDKVSTKIAVTKTKLGKENLQLEIDMIYGEGFDIVGHVLMLAKEYNIVTGNNWLQYGELRAQGSEKAKLVFPMDEIARKVEEKLQEEYAD